VAPESSDTPLLLLDPTLRIRGCNSAYERVSRRRREELIGQRVLDAFPDNPADPQADGTHNPQRSTHTAMGSGAIHNIWVQRYPHYRSRPARHLPREGLEPHQHTGL
jgi:PAS domain-containing protein